MDEQQNSDNVEESAATDDGAAVADGEDAAEDAAVAPTPKHDPGFWELAERTISLCLRVGVVVTFFGLIAIWSFKRDQASHPRIELDPDDVVYSKSNQGAYFQYGELHPAFYYPGMAESQSTAVTLEGVRAHIGQFVTPDSRNSVFRYYQRRWSSKGWDINEDKSQPEVWKLNAIDRKEEVQYSVTVREKDAFNTFVAYSRKPFTEKEDPISASTSIADGMLPKPRGRNETFEVATAPGSIWGLTRTYYVVDGPDIAFNYFTHEMYRMGWSASPMPMSEFAPEGGSRHAMFRLNEYSCMLSVEGSDNPLWGAVVNLVIF